MANLSDTFKYISEFRRAGHQIGRKVGDMLEVLTYAALTRDHDLACRMQVEPKILGFSEAGHKVEFAIVSTPQTDANGDPLIRNGGEISDASQLIGFVECKKVGVEQTVNGTFKRNFSRAQNIVDFDVPFLIRFQPRDLDVAYASEICFTSDEKDPPKIRITKPNGEVMEQKVYGGYRYIFALTADGEHHILDNDASLRAIDAQLRACRILEIDSIHDSGVKCLVNDCLSGPQTPEKAKQASFVALDVRRRRFGSFDKRANESECVSVLVLTEFAHWEDKSQRMIQACIDRNLVVDDSLIVEAFQDFEASFGEHFLEKITKEAFENDADVRALTIDIVNRHDARIFRDIEDDNYKKIFLDDGLLRIE